MKDAEKLAELLDTHPMMKKILAENADAVLAERMSAAEKLRAANEEAGRVIPLHQKGVDAMVAELAEYDAGRQAILDKLTSARAALMGERQRLDRERSNAESDLLKNYDPAIDAAITFFRDRFEGLRVKDINKQTRTGKTNVFTETKEIFIYSNIASIRIAMNYCRLALDELEKMKLSPELDAERIEALKRGVPNEDELTEAVGEKVLPVSRGMNPLHFLKTDDQLAWKMGKITEKFKKVMGR